MTATVILQRGDVSLLGVQDMGMRESDPIPT